MLTGGLRVRVSRPLRSRSMRRSSRKSCLCSPMLSGDAAFSSAPTEWAKVAAAPNALVCRNCRRDQMGMLFADPDLPLLFQRSPTSDERLDDFHLFLDRHRLAT